MVYAISFDIKEFSDRIKLKNLKIGRYLVKEYRRGGQVVIAHDSGSSRSDPGPSPARGHCVMFLGKTLDTRLSYSAPLKPSV